MQGINNPSFPMKSIKIKENENNDAVLHLKLKRPKGLNHVAENNEKVA